MFLRNHFNGDGTFEMPIPMKIYNTFRSRWCGAFLQLNGVKVIPTLAWGGPETLWYFQMQSDGSQVWVTTRDGTIQNGGVNNPPKTWNPDTGYSRSKGEII